MSSSPGTIIRVKHVCFGGKNLTSLSDIRKAIKENGKGKPYANCSAVFADGREPIFLAGPHKNGKDVILKGTEASGDSDTNGVLRRRFGKLVFEVTAK